MHLLVLGGGGFLGYHVVDVARDAGQTVSVFSRSGSAPRDDVEVLVGDRDGDLTALDGREFDAVLDTASDPATVARTARRLQGSVGHYGFVSGMSVYHPDGPAVPDENARVRRPGDPDDPDDPLQARSLDKLAAEGVLESFRGLVSVYRVGIMVGPRDPTDRFTWWPVRLARALRGEAPRSVLVPGDTARAVQYSDVRDIAAFVVDTLAWGRAGTFNTVGPGREETLSHVLDGCLRAAGGSPGAVEWVRGDEATMREALRDVPEEERPLWFPEDQIPQEAIDSSAALRAGLHFRPAEETARDVLSWVTESGRGELAAGFTTERERALIDTVR